MRVVRFESLAEFSAHVTPLLLEREVENAWLLGRFDELAPKDSAPGANAAEPAPLMWAVDDSAGRALAAAMMSPRGGSARRHPVVVSRATPEALAELVSHLLRDQPDLPGVSAPDPTVDDFAAAWCAATGKTRRVVYGLGLHRLTRVVVPPAPGGTFREARDDDADWLAGWADAFFQDLGEPEGLDFCARVVAERIAQRRLYLWCDPDPVSMAGWSGRTPNGVRINFVYTPRGCRRRGYASACVAALSRQLLDSGRQFCTLFTDLANPTSNKIYRSIGYEHVGNFKHVEFV
jgi:predicted GNAT family acetyltransferase